MEVNETVVLAYFFGGFAVLASTIMRYLLSKLPTEEPKRSSNRLLAAIEVINVRNNTLDVKLMLYQYAGVVWLLSGTAYAIILERQVIRGLVENIFEFLVLVVPGVLLMLTMAILKRLFWK